MSTSNISPKIKDKLVEHLNEMLSAENAAVDRLDSRIEECLLQEGKEQLKRHKSETLEHQERLRQIITDLGGSPTDSRADLPTLRLPTGMLAKKTLAGMAKSIRGEEGKIQTLCLKNWNLCIQKKTMVSSMLKSLPTERLYTYVKD